MTVSTCGSKYLSTPSDETSFLISMKARSCLDLQEYAVLLTLELHFVFVEYNALLFCSFDEFGQVSVIIIIIIIIIIINIYIAKILFSAKRFKMLQKFWIKNKNPKIIYIYLHIVTKIQCHAQLQMIHIQMCRRR